MYKNIVAWFSGGVTSAVACKLAIDLFGRENVRVIFMDTRNEHDDTYRFLKDCSRWYQKEIETVHNFNNEIKTIKDVWLKHNKLNISVGAPCSADLKRSLRQKLQTKYKFDGHIFGFDINEPHRAKGMSLNWRKINPIFPLLLYGYSKKDCIRILQDNNIEIPEAYKLGYSNNNCLKTGCVQGGIGYWQKFKKDFPKKFETMAELEHELTKKAGEPVTISKDQTNNRDFDLVFLKKNPNYPSMKDISEMKGRQPEPLVDCMGFCGSNDLKPPKETKIRINQLSFL